MWVLYHICILYKQTVPSGGNANQQLAQLAQLQQVIASQQNTPEQQVALQLLLQQQAAQLMVAQQVKYNIIVHFFLA